MIPIHLSLEEGMDHKNAVVTLQQEAKVKRGIWGELKQCLYSEGQEKPQTLQVVIFLVYITKIHLTCVSIISCSISKTRQTGQRNQMPFRTITSVTTGFEGKLFQVSCHQLSSLHSSIATKMWF